MSYLDHAQDPRRRGLAIGGTAIIQALIAYAVVSGLAITALPRIFTGPTSGTEIPLPTPTPTPTPTAKQTEKPIDHSDHNRPLPPLLPKTDDNTSDHGGTPGTGTIDDPPLPPPPPPHPVTFQPRGASPIGSPSAWALTDDYPVRDLDEGHEGTTMFRVIVGPDGRVGACEIVRSSGFRGLDSATCSAVRRRARFQPATDENGQKVAGSYTNSVRWQIPR